MGMRLSNLNVIRICGCKIYDMGIVKSGRTMVYWGLVDYDWLSKIWEAWGEVGHGDFGIFW